MKKRKYVKSGKHSKAVKRLKYDPWIQVLYLLADMSVEERARCMKAAAIFYDGR